METPPSDSHDERNAVFDWLFHLHRIGAGTGFEFSVLDSWSRFGMSRTIAESWIVPGSPSDGPNAA
jgi:hypothetical protein